MKKETLLTLPILFFSLIVILFGILKFTIYKAPIFMFLIFVYFIIIFLMSIILTTTRNLLSKLLCIIYRLENFALALGILYLAALVIIMASFKRKMNNDIYMADYIFFILMACIVSCYNAFLYIRKLKFK